MDPDDEAAHAWLFGLFYCHDEDSSLLALSLAVLSKVVVGAVGGVGESRRFMDTLRLPPPPAPWKVCS
jgi:hypothetical protein